MNCNSNSLCGFGSNNWWWIIILILIICYGSNGGYGTYGNGCCDNRCC